MQPVEHEEVPHGLPAEPGLNLREAVPGISVESAAALLRELRPSPRKHAVVSRRTKIAETYPKAECTPCAFVAHRVNLHTISLCARKAMPCVLVRVNHYNREVKMLIRGFPTTTMLPSVYTQRSHVGRPWETPWHRSPGRSPPPRSPP